MKLNNSSKLGVLAAVGLSLATFGLAQAQQTNHGHGGGNIPGANPGHGGTPPGNHNGWDKGKHNPHNSPSPSPSPSATATATATPTATVSPTATP